MNAPIVTRAPDVVMRLERMGSFHQCRLSFMRTLLRRMKTENWRFERTSFDFTAAGVGTAVYTAITPERRYSLVAFGHDLPPEMRSDRVIATAWDATFSLFDGVPDDADIERLRQNVPKQEGGRISASELNLSRANRSVRMFEHVVSCLAAGQQPAADKVAEVGYLMRTTAVYGSGKFGAADRAAIVDRPECAGPFQLEMLTVYLIRTFVMDLVEHMARLRAPDSAVPLEPALRRRFGIGNSTGLGMAPFLINHPLLLNNWIAARETAIARVRGVATADAAECAAFRAALTRAQHQARDWRSDHPVQVEKIAALRADLDTLSAWIDAGFADAYPWDALCRWSETALSTEGQEALASLIMEPYGRLVDDLTATMAADEDTVFRIDGAMPVGDLRARIARHYDWALAIDWTARDAQARAWYVSEEKLEPRLGERFDEPIAAYEQPLSPGRDIAALHDALTEWDADTPLATFLLRHPEHRHSARRVQVTCDHGFAEIRDNTIASDMMPVDMLRCKLSFFGASHFDPRSDRWLRINMFQNAPFPDELPDADPDVWSYGPEI